MVSKLAGVCLFYDVISTKHSILIVRILCNKDRSKILNLEISLQLLGLCSALVLSASGATFTGAHSGQSHLFTPQKPPSVSSTQEVGVPHSGGAETSQYCGNWQCVVPVKAKRLT